MFRNECSLQLIDFGKAIDVVLEMKGDMIELMMVYQDIQDKLYDIDRSWQNSPVFHNVKQVIDIEWL